MAATSDTSLHDACRSLLNARRSRHRRNRRRRTAQRRTRKSLLEQLEGRWLLTISTPVLGAGNDVGFNADAVADWSSFGSSAAGSMPPKRNGQGVPLG